MTTLLSIGHRQVVNSNGHMQPAHRLIRTHIVLLHKLLDLVKVVRSAIHNPPQDDVRLTGSPPSLI